MAKFCEHLDPSDIEWITVPEAAAMLGIGPATMRHILARSSSHIESYRPNKQLRVKAADVIAYRDRRKTKRRHVRIEQLEEVLLD